MAVRVRLIGGSDEGFDGTTAAASKKVYRAWDPADRGVDVGTLQAAVLATAPSIVGALYLDKITRDYDEAGDCWVFTVDYTERVPESTLRWSFDTQGGSIRITNSLNTNKYPAAAANMNGAIGYSGDQVEGVDKVIPALKLTASYRWPANTFTTAAANTIASMTGTTNSAAWQGYAAGELLFLGASGEIVPNRPVEVTYYFAASANATGLSIGSITGIAKKGHEYLWILWEDDEDATAKRLTKNPLAVYVERIYAEAVFTSLGIG